MVEYPQNDLTRMIEMASQANASGVRPASLSTGVPMPTAQSADLGREVAESAPLSEAERLALDEAARAAGVRDERLGNADDPVVVPSGYATLEDAINAGAPIEGPVVRVPVGVNDPMRRTFATAPVRPSPPRLPDFRRVEGIDLVRGTVIIDGMEFSIPESDVLGHKEYVVEIARAAITEQLNQAVGLFTAPETAENMDGDQEGEAPATPAV